MEYSMTFLARGVWGNLPIVTMSGPACTIFSTSRRILRRSMSRFLRTLAATPVPSLTKPRRMCSVPMYSWLKRCASWLASCITLRARSVNRSYMPVSTPTVLDRAFLHDKDGPLVGEPMVFDARCQGKDSYAAHGPRLNRSLLNCSRIRENAGLPWDWRLIQLPCLLTAPSHPCLSLLGSCGRRK